MLRSYLYINNIIAKIRGFERKYFSIKPIRLTFSTRKFSVLLLFFESKKKEREKKQDETTDQLDI